MHVHGPSWSMDERQVLLSVGDSVGRRGRERATRPATAKMVTR